MPRGPVLVDSSIWIDHLNHGHAALAILLKERRVFTHPLVIGEIAMGSLKVRQKILHELGKLPGAMTTTNAEVLAMIEWEKLFNRGIGFIDAHLLASAKITANATLLTKDGRLNAQAERLGVAYATNCHLRTPRISGTSRIMIVCVCNAICEDRLRAAARRGAPCPRSAYANLGHEPQCGTCLPFAREIIDDERASLLEVASQAA